MTSMNRLHFGLISLLFVLSGATGLAYEVIWFRRFTHVWGSSSLAMAAVIGSFLLGLGLGARLLGSLADRMRSPLRGYALCELGIGVLALLMPLEIGMLRALAAELYPSLSASPLLHTLVRFLTTFLLLGPPCFLMGATLPLLIRYFSLAGQSLGQATAWLYAFNTLGGALGVYLSGFYLLPSFGLVTTNVGVALTNLVIALIAALAVKRGLAVASLEGARVAREAGKGRRSEPASAVPSPAVPISQGLWPRAILPAALLIGFGAIVLQVVWTRQLALLLGGTTYAFSAMLGVFIAGIGLGSLFFRLALQGGAKLAACVVGSTLSLVLFTLGGWSLQPFLAQAVGHLKDLRASGAFNAALSSAVSAVLQLVPTFAMGVLFPALVALTGQGVARAGRTVGSVYAWNTAGAILGAGLTGLLLLPRLGAETCVILALCAYILAQLLLFPPRWGANALPLAAALSSVFALLVPWTLGDPLTVNLGLYLYGAERYEALHGQAKILSMREGETCNVLVLEMQGGRNLRVNGKVDGSSFADMETQLGLAYLPRFLRPEAKDVLVVGFGTGTTSGASLLFPGTSVTCLEIEPEVFNASQYFHAINHRPEASSEFEIILDDARSYVQGTEESYDLILSAPSNPWMAGISSLFTREFYQAVRSRLGGRGLLAQWVQAYWISPEDYAMIVRTIRSVFPHVALLRISDHDTILVASDAPVEPTADSLDAMQRLIDSLPQVRMELERTYDSADVRVLLLEHMLLDKSGVERFLASNKAELLNTDANLRLEFGAPLHLFDVDQAEGGAVITALFAACERSWPANAFLGWRCRSAQIEGLRRMRDGFIRHGRPDLQPQLIELALSQNPDEPVFVADRLLMARFSNVEEFERLFARLLERDAEEAYRVGSQLARYAGMSREASAFQKALVALEALSQRYPDSATVLTSLAIVYTDQGQQERAAEALQRAVATDPLNRLTHQIERAMSQHGVMEQRR